MNVTTDKTENLRSARRYIDEASKRGSRIVTLPECFQSPYATDKFEEYSEVIPGDLSVCSKDEHPSMYMLREAAKANGVYVVGGSIPERDADKIYNTSVAIDPSGAIVAKHRKVHLFDIDVKGGQRFKESDTLSGGSSITTFSADVGERTVKVGLAICYDLRFPELSQIMREDGCGVLIFPAAFNTTTGPLHWELLLRARAVDQQCFVVAASPARSPDPSAYQAWGHSMVVSPWGHVLAGGEDIQEREGIVYADVDLNDADNIRESIPVSYQRRNDLYELRRVK